MVDHWFPNLVTRKYRSEGKTISVITKRHKFRGTQACNDARLSILNNMAKDLLVPESEELTM